MVHSSAARSFARRLEKDVFMRTLLPMIALTFVLIGCKPMEVGPGAKDTRRPTDPIATAPVELPPSISVSRKFRCTDNSLVVVDFMSDGKSANVVVGAAKAPAHIVAAKSGEEMKGGGISMKGSKDDGKISISTPFHAAPLTCHV